MAAQPQIDCVYPVLDGTDHGVSVIQMLINRGSISPTVFQVKGTGKKRKFLQISLSQGGLMFLLHGSGIDHTGKYVPDELSDLGFYHFVQFTDPKNPKRVHPDVRHVLDHLKVHKCLPNPPEAEVAAAVPSPANSGPRGGKRAAATVAAMSAGG